MLATFQAKIHIYRCPQIYQKGPDQLRSNLGMDKAWCNQQAWITKLHILYQKHPFHIRCQSCTRCK